MKLFTLVSGMAVVMVAVSAVAQEKPAFEAADVHTSPRSTELSMRIVLRKGGRYELHNATMLDLIRTAYGVNEENVVGGPSWLELDRFDVIAKIPSNTSPEASNLMLQSLLADRFQLIVHNDDKSLSKLALLRKDGTPKVTTPAIVVDQVNRQPTVNPPDLKAKLPPLPTSFEVADIKPKNPGAQAYRPMTFSPTGRLSAPLALRYMILLAWNLPSSEELADAPKWLTSTQPQFDVTAEVPASILAANDIPVPLQDLAPMFQTMLKDRLKMESHFEDRLVTAYTLISVNPKLKQANPSTRTKCMQKNVPTPGSVVPDRVVTCQNITMEQFTAQLQAIAGTLYLSFPVIDGTHMDGAWDFTFTFSPIPPNPASNAHASTAVPDALRPATPVAPEALLARTSLFDALERDLGLKLDGQKRPYPLLVIDHLGEKPTEN
jgi:uncharacterized protein (TIGR03435 family)